MRRAARLHTYTSPTRADVQLEALYGYAAERPDELSLAVGDVVVGLRHTAGWWYGARLRPDGSRGDKGHFPANFVREVRLLDSVLDWAMQSADGAKVEPPPPQLLEHLQLRVRDGPALADAERPPPPESDLDATAIGVASRLQRMEKEQKELRRAVTSNVESRVKEVERRNQVLESELLRVAKAAARTAKLKDEAEGKVRELTNELDEFKFKHGMRDSRHDHLVERSEEESKLIAELRAEIAAVRADLWKAEKQRDEAKRVGGLTTDTMLQLDAHETMVVKSQAKIVRLEREQAEMHAKAAAHRAELSAMNQEKELAEAVAGEQRLGHAGALRDALHRMHAVEQERDDARSRIAELELELERALQGRQTFGIVGGAATGLGRKKSRFKKVGLTVGLQVWRVELDDDGETVHYHTIKKSKQGHFAVGDSYLVLSTSKNANAANGLSYAIYLYIGAESELDERRTAAEKIVDIENALPGDAKAAVFRVVGGRESKAFLRLWRPTQYKVVSGGSDTAYDPECPDLWNSQLLQVKGTAKNMTMELKPLQASCMNHGDVFLMNAGEIVYTWYGRESSVFEKREGARFAHELADRQGAVVKEADLDFWDQLEGDASYVVDADDDDDAFDGTSAKTYSLMLLSDARNGELEVVPLMSKVRKLDRDLLDSDDCFVVDLNTQVVVWIGKGSTEQEKRGAMSYVEHYLDTCEARHITKFTPVRRVNESDPWPKKMERAFGKTAKFSTAIGAVLSAVHIDSKLKSGFFGGGAKKKKKATDLASMIG